MIPRFRLDQFTLGLIDGSLGAIWIVAAAKDHWFLAAISFAIWAYIIVLAARREAAKK